MTKLTILLTKTTAVQNKVALSYYRVRGLYFLAVVFAATISVLMTNSCEDLIIVIHNEIFYSIFIQISDFIQLTHRSINLVSKCG